ncbi:MAG TPA: sensor histidine kinase [Desulfobacteraceae bacterium]|nr:sensor histidine kinase [Desulfobacteraceae bacterium]
MFKGQFSTIRGKIIVIFIGCIGFAGILTGVYSWQVLNLKKKLLLMEQFHGLFEDILEVRRYEKNFMYFREISSLKEISLYLDQTSRKAERLAPKITAIVGERGYKKFQADLLRYRTAIEACIRKCGEPDLVELRGIGTSMVDFTQKLLQEKRKRINEMLRQILILPLAYMGGVVILIIFMFQSLAKSILSRIAFVQKATEEVARGNFTPIPNSGKTNDEVTQLIDAFNKMAAELESRWEQLVESRKLASIGTFTSGIAHELNNPLNNISLTAETLLEESDTLDKGESKEMILDIINQASRASEVVRNLLDFSRTEAPSLKKLEVKTVIQETVKLVRNQLMIMGVKLELNLPEDILPICGNLHNLEQVFLNLLLNAIQAMPDGGKITISAKQAEEGYVAIEVSDTGVGIKPDALEKIFDPFFTTKPAGRGTGLGLSIVYGIIKKHGGYVEVKSQEGVGTTFTVYIPACREDEENKEDRQ